MSAFMTSPERDRALREHAAAARVSRRPTPTPPSPPENETAASRRPPYQPPPPPSPPPTATQRHRQPWDIRVVVRLFKWTHWTFSQYPKGRSFIVAMLGGFSDRETADQRLTACKSCELKREKKGKLYCAGCGCGQHPVSRLDRKRWFRLATCPKRLWS